MGTYTLRWGDVVALGITNRQQGCKARFRCLLEK